MVLTEKSSQNLRQMQLGDGPISLILQSLEKNENPFDWENQIRKVCMAYNTSVHASTGYTPFFLMFGHQARLPIDLMYGTGENNDISTSDYATQL